MSSKSIIAVLAILAVLTTGFLPVTVAAKTDTETATPTPTATEEDGGESEWSKARILAVVSDHVDRHQRLDIDALEAYYEQNQSDFNEVEQQYVEAWIEWYRTGERTEELHPEVAPDVPDEYDLEITDGVYLVEQDTQANAFRVTVYVAESVAPATAVQGDVGGAVEGESGARLIAEQKTELEAGENTIVVPAGPGPAGQMATFEVNGQGVLLEGENTGSSEQSLNDLEPSWALILGAVASVVVAGYFAYRKRTKELERPVRAGNILDEFN